MKIIVRVTCISELVIFRSIHTFSNKRKREVHSVWAGVKGPRWIRFSKERFFGLCVCYSYLHYPWLFVVVEKSNGHTVETKYHLLSSLYLFMASKYNMTIEEFNNFSSVAHDALSDITPRWTYFGAVSFVAQVISTIGKLFTKHFRSFVCNSTHLKTEDVFNVFYPGKGLYTANSPTRCYLPLPPRRVSHSIVAEYECILIEDKSPSIGGEFLDKETFKHRLRLRRV